MKWQPNFSSVELSSDIFLQTRRLWKHWKRPLMETGLFTNQPFYLHRMELIPSQRIFKSHSNVFPSSHSRNSKTQSYTSPQKPILLIWHLGQIIHQKLKPNKRIHMACTASMDCSKVTVPIPRLFPSLSSRMSARTTTPAILKTSFSFFQPTL